MLICSIPAGVSVTAVFLLLDKKYSLQILNKHVIMEYVGMPAVVFRYENLDIFGGYPMSVKKTLFAIALVLLVAVPARAEVKGIYGGLKFIDSIQSTGEMSRSGFVKDVGVSQFSQNTLGGGIFFGYDFFPQHQVPIRAELEYAIRGNMDKSWDKSFTNGPLRVNSDTKLQYNLQTLFFNAYWDFHNSTACTPYIGAGLGMAFINSEFKNELNAPGVGRASFSESYYDTRFAWNIGAGCSYAFTENVSADLAYRFVSVSPLEHSGTWFDGSESKVGIAPNAHEISLGLRLTF